MMRRFSFSLLASFLIFIGIFGYAFIANAEEPIGRACVISVKIQGIFGSSAKRFSDAGYNADQIMNNLTDNDLCEITLNNPKLQAESLFQKYFIYDFNEPVNWFNVVEVFFTISPTFSEKNGGSLYFDKQGFFKEIDNWKNKTEVTSCVPFPAGVLTRLIDQRFPDEETVTYKRGLITKDVVTQESCPIGQITTSRKTPFLGNNNSYFLIGASVQEGELVYANDTFQEDEDTPNIVSDFSLPFSAKNCTNDLNPLGCITIPQLIGKIISLGLGVLGTFALLWFIYAGLLWMFAGGNTDRSSRALKMLLWGALGLIVIFASYAVVTFVFQAFV